MTKTDDHGNINYIKYKLYRTGSEKKQHENSSDSDKNGLILELV